MKDDEIVTLGKNADAYANNQTGDSFDWKLIRDARFAQLVAAAEREACAQVCDEKASKMEQEAQAAEADKEDATSLRSSAWLISVCASRVRARAAIATAKENK
jgi:hypothetical protein